jgi:hypothetical protein
LPGITPQNVGMLKPEDLLAAVQLFDARLERGNLG